MVLLFMSRSLCLVQPKLDMERKLLTLTYPGMKSVSVSFGVGRPKGDEHDFCLGRVCGDKMEGLDCGDAVAEWLTQALGEEGLRLIRLHSRTPAPGRHAGGAGVRHSLANSGQLLVLNRESAADMSANAGGLDVTWTLNQERDSMDFLRGNWASQDVFFTARNLFADYEYSGNALEIQFDAVPGQLDRVWKRCEVGRSLDVTRVGMWGDFEKGRRLHKMRHDQD